MKIRESKNLHYDKKPIIEFDGTDRYEPVHCILISFDVVYAVAHFLRLHFKNGTKAIIKAKNEDGNEEINIIHLQLNDFVGKSYEEIMNNNF